MNGITGEVYLQPRPADYDLDPRLRHHGEQPPFPSHNMKNGHSQRFDSGVADLEMHRVSTSPKSSAMYEYIDAGSHYEVPETLPRGMSHLPNGGRQSTISDSRSVVTDVTSDTEDTATIFKTSVDKKKRYNPLYQPSTEVSSFARNQKQRKWENMESMLRVQCAFLVIISIFAMAALGLSLFLFIFKMDGTNTLTDRIQRLEASNTKLLSDNEELKIIMTAAGFNTSFMSSSLMETLAIASNATSTFEEQLTNLNDQVVFYQHNLSQTIDNLALSVDSQLLNISKMPGPQGPRGAGNFSACTYRNFVSSIGPTSTPTGTSLQPSVEELEKNVVMFAACALTGGSSSSLEANVITDNKVQYKCVCSGKIVNQERICKIHLWLCPRDS